MDLTTRPEWLLLEQNAQALKAASMQLADRTVLTPLSAAGLTVDCGNHVLPAAVLDNLINLALACDLPGAFKRLASGEIVNQTEALPAVHMQLRRRLSHTHQRMDTISTQLRNGQFGATITDVVNLGVGGSDLGPKLGCDALQSDKPNPLRCHFLSTLDPSYKRRLLAQLNPDNTLFIISSKSFQTEETLQNARDAIAWLGARPLQHHCLAITAHPERAASLGLPNSHILPIPEAIGGRYSIWSAVGLPIAIEHGFAQYEKLLLGAHAMDEHVLNTDCSQNIPIIMALLRIWLINFFGANNRAILAYAEHLQFLPHYLQQLTMESLGKRVCQHGERVTYNTGEIIWGGVGYQAQHAFMQALHQGTHLIPTDFILVESATDPNLQAEQDKMNQLARRQLTVLREGQTLTQAKQRGKPHPEHHVMPGNQPSIVITLPQLNAHSLGALLALYEHVIYAQSVIWGINAFDQMGVELAKQMEYTNGT